MQYGVYDQVNSQFVFDVRRHQRIDWQRSHCDGMRKIFSKFLSVTASTNIKDIGEQELCNPALLRRYAKFLDNHFVTGDDERLMCDSAKRYLSGVFDVTKFTFSVQSKLHRCRHRVVQEVEEGFKNSDHLMVI